MYQLYYYPLNASMAPHFILEALGVEYELIKVDRKSNQQKSSEYLALNPAGRIPTLIDNGTAIFESPAICIHLAENHPDVNLIPPLGDSNRPVFFQWMMYLTNTVQAELMLYFYPEKHTLEPQHTTQIIQAQEARITEMLALLDNELADKPYLLGQMISACDFFLFMLCVWADEFEKPPLAFTHLSRYLKQLAKHPAIQTVCEKENLSLADYQSL
ncbi:glutathione S-transferase family protein [Pseudoalteromonas sp. G4]|uniref:glutathione S-transferase family protein n=1 Tax=Pseudoalteromonas sp. G4 TaxID=2992761 RepID=UPI00237E3D51|nr:glutathione S-transferase family protein [Pseudoalteromonas sp. G4]MDE3270872.1 glutathione S-transferase family protein [Pseudoalteromonas sp. G4]